MRRERERERRTEAQWRRKGISFQFSERTGKRNRFLNGKFAKVERSRSGTVVVVVVFFFRAILLSTWSDRR